MNIFIGLPTETGWEWIPTTIIREEYTENGTGYIEKPSSENVPAGNDCHRTEKSVLPDREKICKTC